MNPVERDRSRGSEIWTGIPCEIRRARPEVRLKLPSVTIKSGILTTPTRTPLNRPTAAPVSTPTAHMASSGQPWVKATPMRTLARVTFVAIERSIPPMAMTNVIAAARTMTSEESASIPRMFCMLRNTGDRSVKITDRTMRAIGAVQSVQKSGCWIARRTRTATGWRGGSPDDDSGHREARHLPDSLGARSSWSSDYALLRAYLTRSAKGSSNSKLAIGAG